jgi:hypothetical protein
MKIMTMTSVEQLAERELARKPEVHGENLPQSYIT